MGGSKKDQRLYIKVTREFKQELDKKAKELGIDKSELVRQAILLYMSVIGNKDRDKTQKAGVLT